MAKVAVLLAEGFEEVEAVTPIDFLRRAGIEVLITGISETNPKEISGSRGITFKTDVAVQDLGADLDGVVIPGGMPGAANVAASSSARTLLKKMAAEGKLIGAICAAPAVVLSRIGVIDGKRATCYPGYEKQFKNSQFSRERVVEDGNVITSQGPGTAAEFAIALIKRLEGEEAAQRVFETTLQK